MSVVEDIVIPMKKMELPFEVYQCPTCGGIGSGGDGSCTIGPTEFRVKLASKCRMCSGSGFVTIKPWVST